MLLLLTVPATALYEDDPFVTSPHSFSDIGPHGTSYVALEFYVGWCGHCQAFAPTWKEVARPMSDKQIADFERTKECNFAISPPGIGRFRVNAFIQQGRVGMVMRTFWGRRLPFRSLDLELMVMGVVALTGQSNTIASS